MVAVGSRVGEITDVVVGCIVAGMTVDVGGMEVMMGGTIVAEGEKVDVGLGCSGPEQATNRNRTLMTARELTFFKITPPYPLISSGKVSLLYNLDLSSHAK